MIAPLVGAGLIAGAGSVLGGITGGKGASKAAKTAQKTAQMQIAEAQRREATLTGLYQPTIDRGNAAGDLIGSFLGTKGGDQAAQALNTYRGSTGYQDLLNTGLGSVNANAYARGMGASGATLKALQSKGMALADQNAGQWLGGLQYLNNAGVQGVNGIAGVSNNTMGVINSANQNAGDAKANAALATGAGWTNAFQNIANIGGSLAGGGAFGAKTGSSYSGSNGFYGGPNNTWPGQTGSPTFSTPFGSFYGGFGGRT